MQSLVHNQSIAFPSNGMGFNLRYQPNQTVYVTAGFGDANGNPNRTPTDGLASFGKGEYFEAVEVGWSPNLSGLWAGMGRGAYRFMGWHTAATSTHPRGSGVALSFDQEVGSGLVPFLRAGTCPDDVFRTSVEVSWEQSRSLRSRFKSAQSGSTRSWQHLRQAWSTLCRPAAKQGSPHATRMSQPDTSSRSATSTGRLRIFRGRRASDPPHSSSPPRVATVLIVDDQEDVAAPHALALEGAGYRVIQAESWASAVALLKAPHAEVDLIVTDLVMPSDVGVDAFHRLQSEYGTIPVVVFSGYPNVMRLLHGVLDGGVEWLQKPLDVATVVQAVDRALHRVRA
jgi:CheY-like chemotaxis protein